VFARSSKARLTAHDVGRFGGQTLFDRLARTVCAAGCLPRKELFESWEVARRVRRLLRGGRVIDLAAGHGLLAQILLLLDDSSPEALAVDARLPASAMTLHAELTRTWPRLAGRVTFLEQEIETVPIASGDLVVSIHACGILTDRVLARASAAGARVAVLPCCHDADASDTGELEGWVDPAVAIDVVRARNLAASGYRVRTQTIPAEITPQNRLLIGTPKRAAGAASK
jgi:hypothetical protein